MGITWYFHGLDLILTCLLHLQGLQMVFYMLFLIFTKIKVCRKSDKFDGYPKHSWTLQGSWGSLFQLQGTLYTWRRQGNTKCQGEWWSGLLREIQGLMPCWTLLTATNRHFELEAMTNSYQLGILVGWTEFFVFMVHLNHVKPLKVNKHSPKWGVCKLKFLVVSH